MYTQGLGDQEIDGRFHADVICCSDTEIEFTVTGPRVILDSNGAELDIVRHPIFVNVESKNIESCVDQNVDRARRKNSCLKDRVRGFRNGMSNEHSTFWRINLVCWKRDNKLGKLENLFVFS